MNEFLKIATALADGTKQLRGVSDSPRLDAELLLSRALDVPRTYLFAHPEDALDPWGEFEEPEPPGIPMTLGPAPDGPAGPASGVDLGTGRMAAELNWKI